ncbi:sporulation membrane protein YtaF [Halobacillus litoralis]|uniref:sporulation membrane protein YtaF n=1 Tax=Halobacillus litoralis TaxID=45668 RepID=UPI001CD44CD5|nr:sporulation membrane protein YtaF [Halobacillus litoralis]MCA0969846.1 sporulation membrane protein YtaF [Halobacillus litoralis]
MGVATFTFLFVLAVSIDSFGIGCVLGMQNVRIHLRSIALIAVLSGVMFLISSYSGHLLLLFISAEYVERIGAIALIIIGTYFLWQYFKKPSPDEEKEPWLHPERVLHDPLVADVDRSGGIVGKEVWFLGVALSLDTIGAGISGAFIGMPPLFTAVLITLSTCLMLFTGVTCGAKWSEKAESVSILPGVLLIIIGLIKLT